MNYQAKLLADIFLPKLEAHYAKWDLKSWQNNATQYQIEQRAIRDEEDEIFHLLIDREDAQPYLEARYNIAKRYPAFCSFVIHKRTLDALNPANKE
jgi:hypothetical protein